MDLKNIMRNVTPSLTVMAVGLMGAYFVYNTYFSDRVASGFASFEPAAGQEALIETIEDDVILEKEDEKKDIADEITDEIEAGIKSLN